MSTPDEVNEDTLAQKFNKIWLTFRNIENIFGPDLQKTINTVLPKLLIVQKMVEELDMFSLNEEFEDLTNSTLPFILVDAIVSLLYSKKFTNTEERPVFIEEAMKNFKSFNMLSIQYDIGLPDTSVPARNSSSNVQDVQNRRTLLIKSNKEEKQLNSEITAFLDRIDKQGVDSMDESFVREMYLKCIKHMSIQLNKDQENLKLESSFLKNPVKVDPNNLPKNLPPKRKPIIITKDSIQKKVFGKGYPSVPTMTVEEFADLEIAKSMPSQEFAIYKREVENMKMRQSRARERKFDHGNKEEIDEMNKDEETEESLMKARRFDEFKDNVRRGEGNRKGMG